MDGPDRRAGRALLVAAAIAGVAGLALLAWAVLGGGLPTGLATPARPDDAGGAAERAAEPAPRAAPADLVPADPAAAAAAAEGDPGGRAAVEAPFDGAPELPQFRLVGRFVDEAGRPVEGVGVRLHPTRGDWLAAPPPGLESPSRFEATGDASGAFALEGPAPDATRMRIVADGPPYTARLSVDLRRGDGESQVGAHETDLGDLVLAACGAAEGVVTDAAGAPVAGARVGLAGEFPGGLNVTTRTGDDGRYVLGHLPDGVWTLDVFAEGFLIARRDAVTVRVRETTRVASIALEAAPTIEGRVVDEAGEPIAGARLTGWPAGGNGRGVFGRSAADGSFRFPLPQREAYTLGAEKPGFDSIDEHDRERAHEPGSRGIELVLRRPAGLVVRVVDRAGEPVERFGLNVIRSRAPDRFGQRIRTHGGEPTVADHPGGVVEVTADPELDDYGVSAPGYADRYGRFQVDPGGGSARIVLDPEGLVAGRFTVGGEPVAGAQVALSADRIPNDPSQPEDRDDVFESTTHTDVNRLSGRERTTRTDAEGAFRFGRLAAGTYQVVAEGGGAAATRLELVRVEAGATTDLGDVEGQAPASIDGLVRLAPGLSPEGLRVSPGDEWSASSEGSEPVAADGTFRLGGLTDGEHHVYVHAREGVVVERRSVPVTLGPGERRALTIDLTADAPAEVRVTVLRDGAPAGGFEVHAAQTREAGNRTLRLGRANADGVVTGWVFANATTRFLVRTRDGQVLGRSESVGPTPRHDVTIEIATGALALRTPGPPDFGGQPVLILELRRRLEPEGTLTTRHHLRPGDFETLPDGTARATLPVVAAGRYAARVLVDGWLVGEAEVPSGGEAELVLAPED